MHFRRNGQLVHVSTLGDEEDCPFDFRDVGLAKLLQQQQQQSASPSTAPGAPRAPVNQRWLTRDALLHSLSFSTKGLKSSSSLSMDVVGLHDAGILLAAPGAAAAAAAAATASTPPPVLISEVELQEDGSKVVTLRSRVCVQNKAGKPIYLLVIADNTTSAAGATAAAARPNLSISEEVLLQPEETKYISAALLGPATALFVRASPAHGWAPLFTSIGGMDAFMEGEATATDGSGATPSLVCESPPLDEDALPVPNDDSEDIFLAGSSSIGVEICTDQIRGSGAAAGASGGAGGRAGGMRSSPVAGFSSSSSSFADSDVMPAVPPFTALLRSSFSSALQQRESFESATGTGRDSLGDNSLLPGIKGEMLYIRRHDTSATALSLRNLAAIVKRSASGVGGGGGTSSSSRRAAAARAAAAAGAATSHAVRRIILRPAFVLHNLYPTPLLYRLCDKNGYVTAEGALPVGASVPLFGASVKTKQYLSVRTANYLWSSYTRVHTPKAPYPLQERVCAMEMKGLSRRKHQSSQAATGAAAAAAAAASGQADFDVPTQVVSVSLLGRHVRLFGKVAVCNRSSLLLDYRDGSLAADVATTLASGTTGYLRQPPLGGGGGDQAPSSAVLFSPPLLTPQQPPSAADALCPPAIGVKIKAAGVGEAATAATTTTLLPRPVLSGALGSAEGGKATHAPIVTVHVALPFNHLDSTSLQLSSGATLEELFAQLTEKVRGKLRRKMKGDIAKSHVA